MRRLQTVMSFVCAACMVVQSASAQSSAVRIDPPKGGFGWLTRPYQQRYVPDIENKNSTRLESLIRAGNLYLTVQDVIALALENNVDIEVQRYGPLLAQEVLKRAEGGGALRDFGVSVAPGPTSVSLTGVSVNASGGASTGAAGAGVSSSGGITTQLGPALLNLDPQVSLFAQFAHSTTPQSNTTLTGTTALVFNTRTYQAQFSKNWVSGTSLQLSYSSVRNRVNSSFYSINPYTQGALDLYVSQNLLQGFGASVNGRNIIIAKNNEKVSELQFKQQVITTVSAVLNLYWDLVSFYQDLKARKDELATAQQLYNDNKKQVAIGTLAPIEVTRAESQVYTAQQDLLVAQTNLLQQETVLKNALSRNGVQNPLLANVHVIPLDKFEIPPKDDIKPVDELFQEALGNRIEVAQDRLNIKSSEANLKGIKNGLRPTLQAFAEATNNGLTGVQNALALGNPQFAADPFLVGGYGNLLGQIFRRNYPNYSAGISLNIPLRNRAAQADYVTSQLQLRQTQLQLQKEINQIRVDVQNAEIGLQQARARYDSSVRARILQQETLDADQKKYKLGASTVFQVVQDQQNLATAQSNEVQAMANYSHARVQFDQALGNTLATNHISLADAQSGHVSRQSTLPANLPAGVETMPTGVQP